MTEKYIVVNNNGEKVVGTMKHLVGLVDGKGNYIGCCICDTEEELLGTLTKMGNTIKVVME